MKVITFEKMQEILETLIDKLNTINDKFASKESLKITDDTLKSLSDSYNEHGPHTGLSFDLPKPAENEAQAGTSNNAARADHVHPLQTSVLNAETATKLTKSIDITIGGNKKSFDGSNNISWTLDEMSAAKKEHTHDFSPSNHNHDDTYEKIGHNHDNTYEKIGHNHDNRYEKIGHNHSYNDLTDLPDLSEISGGLNITDTIILKSYESGKKFELNVTPTGNLITKESSKSEYSEVILRDGDNNKFKLIINDKGALSIEPTTYENKFKDTYIQAQYPYAEIFRISVFTDNDGSVLMTSSLNKNFINDNGAYNNYTWSSIKILEETNKAKVDVSDKQDKTDNNLNTTNKTVIGAINELKTKVDETFQSANNGKQLIANAIGDSGLTSNSTFSAMSNAITDKRDRLYNLMAEGGYEVNSSMNMDSLLNLLELSGIGVNDIRQIAGGEQHTVILKKDGSLYSCGANTYGQLGLEDTTERTFFTKVTTNVKQIACGANHTFILKKDGSLYSCGANTQGQLGLGDDTKRTTFTKVTTNVSNDVKQVACGQNYTVILKNDGSVWACGYNNFGQLGFVNTATKNTFTQVTTNANNVEQISCGDAHTFILKNDGTVWSCGYNGSGQLGLGNTTNKSTFTKVTTNTNNDIKQVACGQNCTFILKNNGSVWACGYNNYGQLGLGTTDTNYNTFTQATKNINNDVKQIACGEYHTVILKNDGSIWSCGRNDKEQLGISGASDKNTFTQVTTNINYDVKLIACGGYHTFILKTDGSVWSCGYNYHGQLGLNNSYETGGFTAYTDFTDILRGL